MKMLDDAIYFAARFETFFQAYKIIIYTERNFRVTVVQVWEINK